MIEKLLEGVRMDAWIVEIDDEELIEFLLGFVGK